MTQILTSRQRLETVFAGQVADRTPILGGWIANPALIQTLTGIGRDAYWADPTGASLRAYEILGMDGLIDMFVPAHDTDFRCVDAGSYAHAATGLSLEESVARIEAMPTAAEIEAGFDMAVEYPKFRDSLLAMQARCGAMVWMPAQWWAGAKASWYFDFGYENYFMIVGAFPDHARKLMAVGGATGYNVGRLIARAVEEGLYPHAVLLGEDICTQRGPMISPDFLAEWYAPQLRHGLEPLLQVGCKPVWHCDGDVRPILDMLLACGVQGLQGFQPECGLTIDYVAQKRTREGKPLLIFGPMAVTTELPLLTPAQIRASVRRAIDVCRGHADLVLFTSNTINPDIPLENLIAMYEAAREG